MIADEVGPGTHMCLYQRIFVAPGIILTLDTHRVTTSGRLAADEIRQRAPIEILLRPTRYISNIKVKNARRFRADLLVFIESIPPPPHQLCMYVLLGCLRGTGE